MFDPVRSRSPDNLDRLGRALRRMGAQIRTEGDPVSAPLDGPFLANMPLMLDLVTDFGEIDLTFQPAGRTGGYDGWRIGATRHSQPRVSRAPANRPGRAQAVCSA
jgi:hypothetical protein